MDVLVVIVSHFGTPMCVCSTFVKVRKVPRRSGACKISSKAVISTILHVVSFHVPAAGTGFAKPVSTAVLITCDILCSAVQSDCCSRSIHHADHVFFCHDSAGRGIHNNITAV